MEQSSTNGKQQKTPIHRPWEYGPAVWLASGAWLGFAPIAPGTVGALWGIPLAWSISRIPSLWLQAAVIVVLFLIGIPLCTKAARLLQRKDPGMIVWDEIATVPITFFAVSANEMNSPIVLAVGFILHRVFDISKPPPAKQMESLPEGTGIMVDDVVAGVYSCILLHVILWSGWLTFLPVD